MNDLNIYRARVEPWGIPISDEHERLVLDRVRVARETGDLPVLHSHAFEEMGLCVECDAAMVLGESIQRKGLSDAD